MPADSTLAAARPEPSTATVAAVNRAIPRTIARNELTSPISDFATTITAACPDAGGGSSGPLWTQAGPSNGNSLAVICWHISGNLESRFTDFLTSDGEKPWRDREQEFAARSVSRAELKAKWERGWGVLGSALAGLADADLSKTVTIRGQALAVHEALYRALAHISYHVGQVVFLAKHFAGSNWTSLSIPKNRSAEAKGEFKKGIIPGGARGS